MFKRRKDGRLLRPGEKLNRFMSSSTNPLAQQQDSIQFVSEEAERQWIRDRMAEASLLIRLLDQLADDVNLSADQGQRRNLRPGRLGRLTDAGRARRNQFRQTKAEHSVENFLNEVHRHRDFREQITEIPPLAEPEAVDPEDRFSRIRTKLAMKNQVRELVRMAEDLRKLRRRMGLSLLHANSEDKLASTSAGMDRMVLSVAKLADKYRQGEEN
mgnify:CR=1 FL=1